MHHLPMGTVTLLFTDMEGSTRLLQQVGERYTDLLEEYRQLLRAAFQRWNGNVVDTQGDAFFVTFARATDAARGAVAAQRALVSHVWLGTAEYLREALGTPLQPVDRAAYERLVAATSAQLGGQAFAAAWAEGRTMTPRASLGSAGSSDD